MKMMGYPPWEGDGQRCSQAMNGSDKYSCDSTESNCYHRSSSPLSPPERSADEWMKFGTFLLQFSDSFLLITWLLRSKFLSYHCWYLPMTDFTLSQFKVCFACTDQCKNDGFLYCLYIEFHVLVGLIVF